MITREDTLKYLRKQCYFFRDGKTLFEKARKQIKNNLAFEDRELFVVSWLENADLMNFCLHWSQTSEGTDFWGERSDAIQEELKKYGGTSKLPDRTKPLFVEVKE